MEEKTPDSTDTIAATPPEQSSTPRSEKTDGVRDEWPKGHHVVESRSHKIKKIRDKVVTLGVISNKSLKHEISINRLRKKYNRLGKQLDKYNEQLSNLAVTEKGFNTIMVKFNKTAIEYNQTQDKIKKHLIALEMLKTKKNLEMKGYD